MTPTAVAVPKGLALLLVLVGLLLALVGTLGVLAGGSQRLMFLAVAGSTLQILGWHRARQAGGVG